MAKMSARMQADPLLLRVEPFKGVNASVTPTQIEEAQSPEMLNMNIDERGALNKRTGYSRIIPKSVGQGKINGMFVHKQLDGTETFFFAQGNELYTTTAKPSRNNKTEAVWSDDDLTETWGG
ncbi:hypothetical protein LRR81_08695 [Metabacillus sp. GX 13764]|uniref:hypothetical protein n=1 Tax=Metabacillus kandeliae TaxID=2900151 RepID=UPI001E37DF86|nr:hypothetical protein [Metabacillus kandeliae]MCD7034311.1 hypothetical protein [Metabacillus kandeliae]